MRATKLLSVKNLILKRDVSGNKVEHAHGFKFRFRVNQLARDLERVTNAITIYILSYAIPFL